MFTMKLNNITTIASRNPPPNTIVRKGFKNDTTCAYTK